MHTTADQSRTQSHIHIHKFHTGITYYYDRPDVLATMTTRIEADKEKYPVLLGNGNLAESGDAGNGRCAAAHAVTALCEGVHLLTTEGCPSRYY